MTATRYELKISELPTSDHWKSQTEARKIVEENGCRLCTWKYPGEILDVAGDLWCHHCVREHMVELPDEATALLANGETICNGFGHELLPHEVEAIIAQRLAESAK